MMTSKQIRAQFIDFFVQKHGHTFVPSSPVVPADDPTLLFTNAGMNQFKPIFLGQEKRPYTRAVNTQKCIRAGGKHNDLDDVGRSRRHHTFFEMLGNWSFGDYFKQGAIEMSWELLTKLWKLDPARIHVSCFEGDEKNKIPRDTQAADIWKQVAGFADDHIHYFGKDNFWMMGDTGPCGPCTEIYYDRRPANELHTPSPVNGDDPRVMEIWNNVFIQYNRDAEGKLTTLPAQHVDTGMGLERICQVLQGKDDNFGIDLWTPIFDRIAEISNLKYTGRFPKSNTADPVAEAADPQLRHDIAFRVVADHARCLTFALTDGAVPGNEGRGYVLRRILRRAVRFGRQHLGLRDPFMHGLVPVIVDSMSDAFPELKTHTQHVMELIKDEEVSFGRTLDRGIQLFDEAARAGTIRGEDAFKLHDTYGFPIDLTRIMAEERGMSVDIAGYEKLMERAKEIARAGGSDAKTTIADLTPDALAELAREGVKPTDDHDKFSHEPIQTRIMAIWNGDDLGLSPANAFEDEEIALILEKTNFYSEMGGQAGDSGVVASATTKSPTPKSATTEPTIFDVQSTRSIGGYILHIGKIRTGTLHALDAVTATVDSARNQTEKNHTSTHLANWALREVLGDTVQQKGSLVDPEKLRFDFSHAKALATEEIDRVETLVNQSIEKKLPVYAQEAPQEKALKINGLRAVFGEKYPPMVRVVSVGVPVEQLLAEPANPRWRQYSVEFCGGTHLASSSQAAHFAITAEESVSKGIRRLVALTGEAAQAAGENARLIDALISQSAQAEGEALHAQIAALQKASAAQIPLLAKRRAQAAIGELQARLKASEKSARSQSTGGIDAVAIAGELLARAEPLGPGKLIVGEIPGANDDQLRSAVDSLKKKAGSFGILLSTASGEKVTFVAAVSDDLIARGLKAGDWIKAVTQVTGGGGGGRPQMAQGSGKDAGKMAAALDEGRAFAAKAVSK